MKRIIGFIVSVAVFGVSLIVQSAEIPSTRNMNFISWQEFQKFVPVYIETVLLPVGTLEAHGVIPNGADNIAPEAMALGLADRLNAMVAPPLNYGVTGMVDGYPGTFAISEKAYEHFVSDIVKGLAANHFKNIIILNGHGGPQTAILKRIVDIAASRHRVRISVLNWWTVASDVTQSVFGEDGSHAGDNETAYIQAIVPNHVHPQRYTSDMASALPKFSGVYSVPFPSSIMLYKEGESYPKFNKNQAEEYYRKVNNKMAVIIEDIISRWDKARLYR